MPMNLYQFLLAFTKDGPTSCKIAMPCKRREWSMSSTFSQLSEYALSREIPSSGKASITAAFNKAKTAAAATGAPGFPSSLQYQYGHLCIHYYNIRFSAFLKMFSQISLHDYFHYTSNLISIIAQTLS